MMSHKHKIKAHVYFTPEGQEMVNDMEEMGCEVEPVDPFGGYVAPSKDDDKNLEKARDSIKERFQMED